MSDKTTVQKLTLKPRQKLLFVNAPKGYQESLGTLPEGVRVTTKVGEKVDMIQVFATSRNELEASLPRLKDNLNFTGMIWVTYPKGTSRIRSDINRDSIRELGARIGLEAVAIFSVDDDWSALRLKVLR